MKSFCSSYVSKFIKLMIFCSLGVTTLSIPVMAADKNRELQNEISKRGISPEEVNKAMRDRFPDSDFPYFAPVNGCSTPWFTISLVQGSNRWFSSACNNHDRCYATPGKSKSICDGQMWREMSQICESISNIECRTTAAVYYEAVYSAQEAQKAYDIAQRSQLEYIESVYAWLNNRVFYTNHFVNTGILVSSGDKIRIRASGTIDFGLFTPSGDPSGIPAYPIYNYFIDIPHGRLMARFRQRGMRDLDGWFPIGEGWDQVREITLPLPGSGVLEFLVNDNKPRDNVGEFRVEVTIDSANTNSRKL